MFRYRWKNIKDSGKTTGFVFSRKRILWWRKMLPGKKKNVCKLLVQFLTVSYRGDLFFDVRDKHSRNSENPGILTLRTCARFKSRNSTIYKRTGTSLVVYELR